MTLIVDAGPLLALADRSDPQHAAVERTLRQEPGRLVLSAFCAAEADYLIARDFGSKAQRTFLQELASGQFEVLALSPDEHLLVVELDDDYPGMGLADLSIVLLAARYDTRRILTFDERHFRAVVPLQGGAFTLLPVDDTSAPG